MEYLQKVVYKTIFKNKFGGRVFVSCGVLFSPINIYMFQLYYKEIF